MPVEKGEQVAVQAWLTKRLPLPRVPRRVFYDGWDAPVRGTL
jgi:hypothetical protein